MRAINVGSRRVSSAELAAAFEAAEGIEDASGFLASGNVAFTDTTRRGQPAIAKAIEAAIEQAFGWKSATCLRSAEEMALLAGARPFAEKQLAASAGKPQLILFADRITPDTAAAIDELSTPSDRLVPGEREIHWLPRGGLADSELDLSPIEPALGLGTTRTANTVRRMHAKFFAGDG